jgi:hypothetical protein
LFVDDAADAAPVFDAEASGAFRSAQQVDTVCDQLHQQWEQEISALPARKQKKWSGWTLDEYGCRTSVRYSPQQVSAGHQTLFEMRLTARMAAARGLDTGSWIPLQPVSALVENAARLQAELLKYVQDGAALRRAMAPYLDGGALLANAGALLEARRTGNHRSRVHTVRVPTAAGQPVRG